MVLMTKILFLKKVDTVFSCSRADFILVTIWSVYDIEDIVLSTGRVDGRHNFCLKELAWGRQDVCQDVKKICDLSNWSQNS